MAELNYRTYLESMLPGWLKGYWGERFMYTSGLVLDATMEGAREATRVRFMIAGETPPDALSYLGFDSNLERYPADTDATYLARLIDRWESWKDSGRKAGVIGQLNAFGFTSASIYSALELDPTDLDFSRFWVVLDPPHGWTWPTWDSAVWDVFQWDAFISPLGAVVDLAGSLRRLVRKFKGGHERCEQIIVLAPGAEIWDHNFVWDTSQWDQGGVAAFSG